MDVDFSAVVAEALDGLEIPRAIETWRDEIEGAAQLGIARAIARVPSCTRDRLVMAARRAALNEIRDEMRRKGATVTRAGQVKAPPASYEPLPDDIEDEGNTGGEFNPPLSLATSELANRARGAAMALPKLLREVIALRYIEGLTQAEAAQRLGVTQGTIARREARALARLRRAMSDDDTGARKRTRVAGVPVRSQQGQAA